MSVQDSLDISILEKEPRFKVEFEIIIPMKNIIVTIAYLLKLDTLLDIGPC